MYADFAFYQENYLGEVIPTEREFIRMERKAAAFLDELTIGRIQEVVEPVKMAACEIAEIEYKEHKQNNEDQIASETVGPHSVSYVKSTKTSADYHKDKLAVARTYLFTAGLLYRGI